MERPTIHYAWIRMIINWRTVPIYIYIHVDVAVQCICRSHTPWYAEASACFVPHVHVKKWRQTASSPRCGKLQRWQNCVWCHEITGKNIPPKQKSITIYNNHAWLVFEPATIDENTHCILWSRLETRDSELLHWCQSEVPQDTSIHACGKWGKPPPPT